MSLSATQPGIDRKLVLARFANNLPRHISVVARALNQQLVSACTAQGYSGVRAPFVQLLFQLRPEGRRLVDIAQYCGLTQQVAGQIADELERLGYLSRKPDLSDRRAKRLLLTRKGERLAACAEATSARIEQELSQLIGAAALADFKRSCTQLFNALVAPRADAAPPHNPAAALPLCLAGLATFCERTLMDLDKASGYRGLKMSFAQVLTYSSPHGTLINDLARINNVSKQAISQVVKQVEQLGYVQRRQHPCDRRSTMIFLTDSGLRLIRDSLDNLGRIEADLSRVLGSSGAARFATTAEQLFMCLDTGVPRVNGEHAELSTEAILHRAMERLYLDSGEALRARLFNRAGRKAKLSSAVLKTLRSLEIRISD